MTDCNKDRLVFYRASYQNECVIFSCKLDDENDDGLKKLESTFKNGKIS